MTDNPSGKFFYLDPFCDGFVRVDTAAQAQDAANELFDQARRDAGSDGEWPGEIELICWGEVCEDVTLDSSEPAGDDYALAPLDGLELAETLKVGLGRLERVLREIAEIYQAWPRVQVLVDAANLLGEMAKEVAERKARSG